MAFRSEMGAFHYCTPVSVFTTTLRGVELSLPPTAILLFRRLLDGPSNNKWGPSSAIRRIDYYQHLNIQLFAVSSNTSSEGPKWEDVAVCGIGDTTGPIEHTRNSLLRKISRW